MKHRCLGALHDAAMSLPVAVDPSDARLVHASAPPKWGSTIEHSRGSSPGQITQYSTTPGQDEVTSEEGLDAYYDLAAHYETGDAEAENALVDDAGAAGGMRRDL